MTWNDVYDGLIESRLRKLSDLIFHDLFVPNGDKPMLAAKKHESTNSHPQLIAIAAV
jgi:hypothetical protein